MIDKAATVALRTRRSRRMATASLAFVVVLLLIGGKAGAPYLFQGATLQSELATQMRATTGLVVTTKDHGRFDLLPRPHVVMRGLHFTDPSGALKVDADELQGEVRLLPLLVGRIELGSATLVRPKLALDFDGQPLQADSMIGRTMRHGAHAGATPSGRLGVVTFVDGVVSVKSRMLQSITSFEDVDVTIDWPDLDSPATLTGSFALRKVAADIAIWLAQPSSLMRGETSPLALRVQSTPLDLSANGNLAVSGSASFRGHVTAHAPTMAGILALAAVRVPLPAPFANLAMNSDVAVRVDHDGVPALDLSVLRLALDGNDYEGALALQGGAKPAIAGTLATDQLSVAPFVERVPRLLDARRLWSRNPLILAYPDPIALDLRISASHLHVAPFTIDDAALAVMTRGDRTEIMLAEGKAYGGDVKARASLGIIGDTLSMRGVCTLTNADAAALSWDGASRQIVTGRFSGSAFLETHGSSPAALIEHLNGLIKGQANDGEISLPDLGRGGLATDDKPLQAITPRTASGRTPFHDFAFALRLSNGDASVEDALMHGSDTRTTATGTIGLLNRQLDLHVVTAPSAQASGASNGSRQLDFGGSFDTIVVAARPQPQVPGASAR